MKKKNKFSKDKNFGITLSIIFFIIYLFSLNNMNFKFNNYILISLIFLFISFVKIYFIIIGTVGLIMKLFGYDPLNIKNKKISSFWKQRSKNYDDMESMRDQF